MFRKSSEGGGWGQGYGGSRGRGPLSNSVAIGIISAVKVRVVPKNLFEQRVLFEHGVGGCVRVGSFQGSVQVR